jgi:hypothetical protein
VAGVRCDDEHPSAFLLPRLEPIGSRSSPQKFREQTWLRSSVATPAAVCRTANFLRCQSLPLLLFDPRGHVREPRSARPQGWANRPLMPPPLAGELVRPG